MEMEIEFVFRSISDLEFSVVTRATVSVPARVSYNDIERGQLRMVANDAHTTISTGRQQDSTIHVRVWMTGVETTCPPYTAHIRTCRKLRSCQIV